MSLTRARIVFGVVAAVCSLSATTALSQDHEERSGLYVGIGGGVLFLPESGTKYLKDGKVAGDTRSYHTAYELGWGGHGSLGYAFGDGTRAEAEFSYLTAGVSYSNGTDTKDFKTKPRVTALSIVANGLYLFDTGIPLRPFVGLGIGATHEILSTGEPKNPPDGFSEPVYSGWGVAYQGRAGISYEVSDGLSILLGYRIYSNGLSRLTYERKLDKDDSEYGQYDTEIRTTLGQLWPAHRMEIGVTYRLPF